MLIVLNKIASIFLIIALGFFVGKRHVLPENSGEIINKILLNISCPCMVFSAALSQEQDSSLINITIWSALLSIIGFLILPWVCSFVCKHILKMPRDEAGVCAYCCGSNNSGFFGFPVTQTLFGTNVLYTVIVSNLILFFYLYLYGLIFMTPKEGKTNSKQLVSALLHNVCLVSAVIALIMMFAGIGLPPLLFDTIEMCGNVTTPMAMILVGLMLSEYDLLPLLKQWKLTIATLIKLIINPALTFCIVYFLPIPTIVKIGVTFAFSFPSAVMAAPMAADYAGDTKIGVSFVAISHILSVLTVPLTATILTSVFNL